MNTRGLLYIGMDICYSLLTYLTNIDSLDSQIPEYFKRNVGYLLVILEKWCMWQHQKCYFVHYIENQKLMK